MPELIRAQVVLQPTSALPKDRVVNTFHFRCPTPTEAEAETIAELVRDFYTVIPTGDTATLSELLAKSVTDNGHEVRCYEIDEETGDRLTFEGAPPIHVEAFDLLGRGTETIGMANELALCLSLRNTTEVSVPVARRSGRIYFGPIEQLATPAEGPGLINIPHASTVTRLARAGRDLADDSATAGFPLVVYSRPFPGRTGAVKDNGDPKPDLPARVGAMLDVEQVWVDDEWDVQRRRGRKAGTRTVL